MTEPVFPKGVDYLGNVHPGFYQDSRGDFVKHLHTAGWGSEILALVVEHKRWLEWKDHQRTREQEAAKVPAIDAEAILSALGKLPRDELLRIAQAVNVYVQDYETAEKARRLRVDDIAKTVFDLFMEARQESQRKETT
jgi:hypothetical protein